MALPTSDNTVNVTRLGSILSTMWSKIKTALGNKSNKTEGVYYVSGTTPYTAYSSSSTYTKWTSGDYTSSNSCTYGGYAYYCSTAITTAEAWNASHWTKIPTPTWTGTVTGVTELYTGMKIAYKVPIYGGSSSTYLNINNLGNVYVKRNDGNTTTHLPGNTVVILTYDGTYWRWADYDSNSTYSGIVTAFVNDASNAAKVATSTNFKLSDGITILVTFNVANTKNSALTLNVNSTGAKTLYINGVVSSASNYTIPAGTYFCHYEVPSGASTGNWYLFTDGTLMAKKFKGGEATGSVSGLMSAADKYKLDQIRYTEIDGTPTTDVETNLGYFEFRNGENNGYGCVGGYVGLGMNGTNGRMFVGTNGEDTLMVGHYDSDEDTWVENEVSMEGHTHSAGDVYGLGTLTEIVDIGNYFTLQGDAWVCTAVPPLINLIINQEKNVILRTGPEPEKYFVLSYKDNTTIMGELTGYQFMFTRVQSAISPYSNYGDIDTINISVDFPDAELSNWAMSYTSFRAASANDGQTPHDTTKYLRGDGEWYNPERGIELYSSDARYGIFLGYTNELTQYASCTTSFNILISASNYQPGFLSRFRLDISVRSNNINCTFWETGHYNGGQKVTPRVSFVKRSSPADYNYSVYITLSTDGGSSFTSLQYMRFNIVQLTGHSGFTLAPTLLTSAFSETSVFSKLAIAYDGVYSHTNEINYGNVPASNSRHWFNYRNGDSDALSSNNQLTDYFFGNRNGSTNGVYLNADGLKGNLSISSTSICWCIKCTRLNTTEIDFFTVRVPITGGISEEEFGWVDISVKVRNSTWNGVGYAFVRGTYNKLGQCYYYESNATSVGGTFYIGIAISDSNIQRRCSPIMLGYSTSSNSGYTPAVKVEFGSYTVSGGSAMKTRYPAYMDYNGNGSSEAGSIYKPVYAAANGQLTTGGFWFYPLYKDGGTVNFFSTGSPWASAPLGAVTVIGAVNNAVTVTYKSGSTHSVTAGRCHVYIKVASNEWAYDM